MWFDDWASLEQIVIKAVVGFASLVALLRIAGKRSIAKLNAFDLVLVFTVGSILATTILNTQTTISEGLLALGMLVGLQWLTAWLATRSAAFRGLIKSEPTLLVYEGKLLRANMRRERVADIEVQAALRQQGVHDISQVKAVVLETEGDITVLKASGGDDIPETLRKSGISVPGDHD
ncbi:DUF421 domain-containing protein [Pelagibacterium xiamenense]|uniref:DUF421 domain-containing protein n=1 Tax=Pelagibacterium xiamenense TaxID=2901140 RepID=UPI001E53C1EC|nr:YetF domain-containing protein [Pelagibacterium xiamenense]MCD7058738.1 DUF421 domain-containing protein [Pelagibacterium xiamenense]